MTIFLSDTFAGVTLDSVKWDTNIFSTASVTQDDVLQLNNQLDGGGNWSGAHCFSKDSFTLTGELDLIIKWKPTTNLYANAIYPMIKFCKPDAHRETANYGERDEQFIAIWLAQLSDGTERTSLAIAEAGTTADDRYGTSLVAQAIAINEALWHDLKITINCNTRLVTVDLNAGAYNFSATITQSIWDSLGGSIVVELTNSTYNRANTEQFDDFYLTDGAPILDAEIDIGINFGATIQESLPTYSIELNKGINFSSLIESYLVSAREMSEALSLGVFFAVSNPIYKDFSGGINYTDTFVSTSPIYKIIDKGYSFGAVFSGFSLTGSLDEGYSYDAVFEGYSLTGEITLGLGFSPEFAPSIEKILDLYDLNLNLSVGIIEIEVTQEVATGVVNVELEELEFVGYGSGTADITLEELEVSVSGAVSSSSATNLVLENLIAEAFSSSVSDLELEKLTIAATGTGAISGDASLTLKFLSLEASGNVVGQGQADLILPLLRLNGIGRIEAYGQSDILLRNLWTEAYGNVGSLGEGVFTPEELILSALGFSSISGSYDNSLEYLVGEGFGEIKARYDDYILRYMRGSLIGASSITLEKLILEGTG